MSETDREIERVTDRQIDRKSETDRQRERERERETERLRHVRIDDRKTDMFMLCLSIFGGLKRWSVFSPLPGNTFFFLISVI